MWTPRRVLLLLIGMIGFGSAYGVYAYALGWLDGLPALPERYLVKRDPGAAPPARAAHVVTPIDRKLCQAFGEDCIETHYTIKLELSAKGLVIAAGEFAIQPDGRVMLTPLSVAAYGKAKGPDGCPEINTVHCDQAYLQFDAPVKSMTEMGKRRIIAAELISLPNLQSDDPRKGMVHLSNNRRTEADTDDLTLVTRGPLYYREEPVQRSPKKSPALDQPHIWTAEVIKAVDKQSGPQPTTVTATGMQIFLTDEAAAAARGGPAPNAPPAAKPAGEASPVNGVEKIILPANVLMDLWVDSRGFMAGPNPQPTKAQKSEKVRVEIRTLGPFRYDVPTDRARFDIVPKADPALPNHVEVRRFVRPTVNDLLVSDVLELQFKRKSSPPPAAGTVAAPPKPETLDSAGGDMEIEWAHAWGKNVALSSDSEELAALGDDLVYNAATKTTVLKGATEMVAMKDGSEIHAKELILTSVDGKDLSDARAKGPGYVRALDKQTGKQSLFARWKDTATFSKDQGLDLITLTGGASFEDRDQDQNLLGDTIKVWLWPENKAQGPSSGVAPPPGDSKRRPHHLQVIGSVSARSPDLTIHDSDLLTVWFRDVVAVDLPGTVKPVPASSTPAASGPVEPRPTASTPPPPVAPTNDSPPTRRPVVSGPAGMEKPKKPIDLSARTIETHVLRIGDKHELEKVRCVGRVIVHQDPADASEKGVDIVGKTMDLDHFPEGNILFVTGTAATPAEVHLDKIWLTGPEVYIDQKENVSRINGAGTMKMPSGTDFNGNKLNDPVEMTVVWTKEMFFNGSHAIFQGSVQAEQENARVLSQKMQVSFDRVVSLNRAAQRDRQPTGSARVSKVVCDMDGVARSQPVTVIESQLENGRLTKYQRLQAKELALDNEDGRVDAPGPGMVRILQLGNRSEEFRPDGKPTKSPTAGPDIRGSDLKAVQAAEKEMKLTWVKFNGRMFGNNKARTASFFDSVEVIHVPSEDPELDVNVDQLPVGGLYLRCEQLKVYSRKDGDATYQEMEAHVRAYVQAREFSGRADVVKYDESKELVIFEGTESNPATLYRTTVKGRAADEIKGKKILYWRKTNAFEIVSGWKGDIFSPQN